MTKATYEERVATAIHNALRQLGIASEATFPQLQIRAYHFINIDDFDKSYHLCIPLKQSKRLCYQSRDHFAYAYALKHLNRANNLARAGHITKATQLIVMVIRYFIKHSEKSFIEERVAPYTFAIKMIKSEVPIE